MEVAQKIKPYFTLLFIGLLITGNYPLLHHGKAMAEPMPYALEPRLPGENMDFKVVKSAKMLRMKPPGWLDTEYFDPNEMGMINTIRDAGDRLAAKQDPNTGGWVFYLHETTSTANNIYGAVGLGLLKAYSLTKMMQDGNIVAMNPENTGYLNAARKVAEVIRKAIIDGSFPLQSTDYIFLYYYGVIEGDPNYAIAAHSHLQTSTIDGKSAAETADWLDSRYSGQGRTWQLAQWVEVFSLYNDPVIGDPNFADAIVKKMLLDYQRVDDGSIGGFVYDDTKHYVRTGSHAKGIEVLKRWYSGKKIDIKIDGGKITINIDEDVIASGLALLKDLQYKDGYFQWGCRLDKQNNEATAFPSILVQDQAFAVKAMAFNMQTTSANFGKGTSETMKGPYWGANALMMMQDLNGGFIGYLKDGIALEVSEYNAEAIDALYCSIKEGDVFRNGVISAYDALIVFKASVGKWDLSGPELVAADRDGDGTITLNDAIQILQTSVGIENAVLIGGDLK